MSSVVTLSTLVHDAWRALRIGRGTMALAFLILTLAMAAATVTFSVVDGVALRPLPFASPDRLVAISGPAVPPGPLRPVSPMDYFTWVEGAQTFEGLAAARPMGSPTLELDGVREALTVMGVTANLFDVLGIPPAAGRFFDAQHERPGGPPAVILSHELWARRFRTDPEVIGRHLHVGQQTREVIGVLPAGVWYPITPGAPPDLYVFYVVTPGERSNDRAAFLSVVGRLGRGVSIEQARADVERLGSAVVLPLHERVVGPARTWLLLVLAAVGLVLLIACGNVANLLLARATARVPELATREALGASRRRLAAGLLVEGLILACASAAAGILVSYWSVGIVTSSVPAGLLTRLQAVSVDGRVLVVSIAAAVLCGVLFSSAPAWLAARGDLASHMRGRGGPVAGGRRRERSLAAFVVAQVAVVSLLLVATTLIVTSFILISRADLGFDRQNVMLIALQPTPQGIADPERPAATASLREHLLDRARSVPGVTAAAISFNDAAPMSGGFVRYGITIPGVGEVRGDDAPDANMVTPDYFLVMSMQLVSGRLFDHFDTAGAPPVMVINDVAARRFFPDQDPVGQVVTFQGRPTTIVGVLRGVHLQGPEEEVRPAMYTPLDQLPFAGRPGLPFGTLVVRAARDVRRVAPAVREAIRPVPGLEPGEPRFIEDFFRRVTAGRRFNAGVMATFGVIAVALGAIGVYGMMAFVVARQVRAIGIRMALGATSTDIMRSVLGKASVHVASGIAIGLGAAWAVSGVFRSFVFQISPEHPAVYAAVAGVVALIGLAAAFAPARHAARLDPLEALRHE